MNKLKILIADDEEMLCDLFEMILESEFSCDITKVPNGADAIDALKTSPDYDVIISDYKMPIVSGGGIYLFNKAQSNIPFFLFSGGELCDYNEFKDFNDSNQLNHFFNKPFDERNFLDAIAQINARHDLSKTTIDEQYNKVKLSYYAIHSNSAAEVYIKLSDNKYAKIISATDENIPDKDLIQHYLKKGIEYIYLDSNFFKLFLNDVFNKFQQNLNSSKKAETTFNIAGFNFNVNIEGLNDIGISNTQIERINYEIDETISSLFNNQNSKDQFKKLCDSEGLIIGHSTLIVYIAGKLCRETNLSFSSTMKKICAAAFYHDFSIFDLEFELDETKLTEIKDPKLLKLIAEHPVNSAAYLPKNAEIVEDTKKIILEHHELPNGNGYPKNLTASQISSLSCLFILSQQITFCLIRNNFSQDRLKDFLLNSEEEFNQGNFSKFFVAAKAIF